MTKGLSDKILMYEELSMNAHPASQTQFYDGWVLRFANGYTKRANSVNPLYQHTIDLNEKIMRCEEKYAKQGLPTIFKLTDGSDPVIDKALEARNYITDDPAYVMDMDLHDRFTMPKEIVLTDHADEEWLNAYFSFSAYSDPASMSAARRILENVKNKMVCARIVKDNVTVACGSSVIERGYVSLLNIVVEQARRGEGYGAQICGSLLAAATRSGARTAFLQVGRTNHVAIGMYRKLGFDVAYSYWYRVKKM